MKVLAGLYHDYTGDILIDGVKKDLFSPSLSKEAGIGMLLSAVSLAGCAAGTASSAAASAPAASSAAASAPAAASASASSAAPAAGGNLEESTKLLADAIANLKTTDNHQMMADPVLFDVPQATGTADELAKLPDTDSNKWHYYEYLDWDKGADANLPASPADGQKGKHIILIVHGAHGLCSPDRFRCGSGGKALRMPG